MSDVLLVEGLRVSYQTSNGLLHAVNDVTFSVRAGERFGLVGESGSGKSTTAFALLRLLPNTATIDAGRAWLGETELLSQTETQMKAIRWQQLALVPQGAMNSLNPVMRVVDQMSDAVTAHEGRRAAGELRERIANALRSVGLPERVARLFPHELSGGMKQRVCIAMAILLRPRLIVADEPTSALDVVTQQVVMQTLRSVQEDIGASILLIGHDMALQAQMVDRIGVMYAGQLVEVADVGEVFHTPLHPYTQLLISFVPSIEEKRPPKGLAGLAPRVTPDFKGCVFRSRCPLAMDRCAEVAPPLVAVTPTHWVACHLHADATASATTAPLPVAVPQSTSTEGA